MVFIFALFFLSLASQKEAKQSIRCRISFALTIIDLKVESQKFYGLADSTIAPTFFLQKLMKVIMIGKDKILKFAVF